MQKAKNRTVHPASRIEDIAALTRPSSSTETPDPTQSPDEAMPGEVRLLSSIATPHEALPEPTDAESGITSDLPTELTGEVATVVQIGTRNTVPETSDAPAAGAAGVRAPAGEGLVFPDAPPGQVRRVEVSKRGKRDFNYSWASVDVEVMRQAHRRYMPLYREAWQDRDPGGSYRLVFSAFVARALDEALGDVADWVDTIRNDARKEPVAGGREQVGLVWPVAVENRILAAWETFDQTLLPAGFALTKQHLASAAILHGLRSADQWVLSVGNDDRYNVPVDSDGRLKENRVV